MTIRDFVSSNYSSDKGRARLVTEKERLLSVLDRRSVDRPPVVIPGGMMNAVLVEVMRDSGYPWPQAHTDPEFMAGLALATKEKTGIENVGVPFCMTVEAEEMGSQVDYSSEKFEPHVTGYAETLGDVDEGKSNPRPDRTRRISVVLEALDSLKSMVNDVPIVGNVVGPMSLATSVVDPLKVFRMVLTDRAGLNHLLDITLDCSISFARRQVASGADVIVIADPTATGEILGAAAFAAFEVPRLQKLVSAIHEEGAKAIVHICGNIQSILEQVKVLGADALSFDSGVNIRKVRMAVGALPLMGNISTVLLHQGKPAKIEAVVRQVVNEGVDIVAPACGFSPFTPLVNIQAMCRTVKELSVG